MKSDASKPAIPSRRCPSCGTFMSLIPSIRQMIERDGDITGLSEHSYNCKRGCHINPLDRRGYFSVDQVQEGRTYVPGEETA